MRNRDGACKKPWACGFTRAAGMLLLGCVSGFVLLLKTRLSLAPWENSVSQVPDAIATFGPLLVIYVYSDNDPNYIHNLRFFVHKGVRANDGADYVFVVQTRDNGKPPEDLPKLPENAQYAYQQNECHDFGTIGGVFRENIAHVWKYNYYFFFNAAVRGPFFPAYDENQVHWSDAFLSRINDVVKLVGPTLSCEGTFRAGPGTKVKENPHIQGYVFATDKVGLRVLFNNPLVFGCFDTQQEAVYYSELGASRAILEAGYSLDTLMLRYQGVDWRKKENWGCNGKLNPVTDTRYDGVFVNPLEVLFVKMKDIRQGGCSKDTGLLTKKYTQWILEAEESGWDISANRIIPAPQIPGPTPQCNNELHEEGCFDAKLYKDRNSEIPRDWSVSDLYSHFVAIGRAENRSYRFTCRNQDG